MSPPITSPRNPVLLSVKSGRVSSLVSGRSHSASPSVPTLDSTKRLCISPLIHSQPRDLPLVPPSSSSPSSIPAPPAHATWSFKGGRPATRARRCPPKRTGKPGGGSCSMVLQPPVGDLSFAAVAMHLACALTALPSPLHALLAGTPLAAYTM